MFKSRNKLLKQDIIRKFLQLGIIFLHAGLAIGGLLLSKNSQASEPFQEVVDADFQREVKLSFRAEKNAAKYILEIQAAKLSSPQVFEIASPSWVGKLPVGKYSMRFKVIFIDETESLWSDPTNFEVQYYKFQLLNFDGKIGKIETFGNSENRQKEKKEPQEYAKNKDSQEPPTDLIKTEKWPVHKEVFFNWTSLSEAVSYKLQLKELETYKLDGNQFFDSSSKTQVSNQGWSIYNKIKGSQFKVEGPFKSGVYAIRILAFDENGKVIAILDDQIQLIDVTDFAPQLILPKNAFVREVTWKGPPDFKTFQLKVLKNTTQSPTGFHPRTGSEFNDGQWDLLFSDEKYVSQTFSLPSEWSGGTYQICVTTLITNKTLSDQSCMIFEAKDGDRSILSEQRFYKQVLAERTRQYFHDFEFVTSKVNYSSVNPSQASVVDVDGFVFSGSYAKSNPTRLENINQYYKLNVGFFNLEGSQYINYDFRYGREFSYFSFYPFIFKINMGLGSDRMMQAKTDVQRGQDLTLDSHYLINLFSAADLQYDMYDELSFGIRLGYNKPFYEIMKTNDSQFSDGSNWEYSFYSAFKVPESKNRIQIGYLYRSQETDFRSEKSGFGDSRVDQNGHYLIFNYIMETK